MNLYNRISQKGKKSIAVLIDPDRNTVDSIGQIISSCKKSDVDFIFIGGSLLVENIGDTISLIKQKTNIPVIIFPGNAIQVSDRADGILFLSLISGRNPEYLIGQHVIAAHTVKKSGIEVIPVAYILIENGRTTSVEYMSNTNPIPADKPELVVATALAGEMLGMRVIYLEAGSGASKSVALGIISEVKKNTNIPLIVGGGIRTAEDARKIFSAGADVIVVGSAVEDNYEVIAEIASSRTK